MTDTYIYVSEKASKIDGAMNYFLRALEPAGARSAKQRLYRLTASPQGAKI